MMYAAPVTSIYEHLFRLYTTQPLHLRNRPLERCSIVRSPVDGLYPYYPALLRSRHRAYLASEFVLLVCFAFGYTFHFICVYAVNLMAVVPLLLINATRYRQHLFQSPVRILAFPLYIPYHSTQYRFQFLRTFVRSFHLSCRRITRLLIKCLLAHPLVALSQLYFRSLGRPHQCSPRLVIEPGVGRKG